jgi:hypothetical protein
MEVTHTELQRQSPAVSYAAGRMKRTCVPTGASASYAAGRLKRTRVPTGGSASYAAGRLKRTRVPTGASASYAAGRLKRTRVPTGASASQIRPPCASTIARETARPSPAPGLVRAASVPPR